MNRCLTALVLAATLALGTACSAAGGSGSKGAIVLGGHFDLSGVASTLGKPALQGAQLAVDEINAGGGVLGQALELESADDGCDTAKAVAASRQYLSRRVFMLFGFSCSPVALSVRQLADSQRVPMLVTTATATEITNPVSKYVFNANVSAADEARAVTDLVVQRYSPKKVAVAYVGNDYGKATADGVQAALTGKGRGDAYLGIEIPLDATDYRAQALVLSREKPDVILTVVYSVPPFLTALAQNGVAAPVVSFSGGVLGATVLPLAQQGSLNGFVSSWYAPTQLSTDSTSSEMVAFAKAYHARYNSYPDSAALEGYQGIKLVQKALEKAGVVDPNAFVAALESLGTVDFGLGFPMSFSATDHSGPDQMSLLEYTSNDAPSATSLYGNVTVFTGSAAS